MKEIVAKLTGSGLPCAVAGGGNGQEVIRTWPQAFLKVSLHLKLKEEGGLVTKQVCG